MTTRVLDPDEWMEKLSGTDLPALLPFCTPENTSVVVVEEDGRIVATMGVLRVTHFEGVWIDPEHRGNAGVVRRLLKASTDIALGHGEQFVFGGASDDRMRDILGRLGGVRMPLEFYALSIGSQECRQQ